MQFFNLGNTGGAFKFDNIDAITQDPATGVLSFVRSVGNTSYQNETDEQKESTTETIDDFTASKKVTFYKDSSNKIYEKDITNNLIIQSPNDIDLSGNKINSNCD